MTTSGISLFRKACGLDEPLVLECRATAAANGSRRFHEFPLPYVMVGRDTQSDLCLPGSGVSRTHAYIQAVDGRLLCTDLGSRTGLTWVDDRGGGDAGWLDADRVLRIDDHEIRRVDRMMTVPANHPESRSLPSPAQQPGHPAAVPVTALELPFRVEGIENLWAIEAPLAMIGRSDRCQMVLSDESISRFHAALLRTSLGLWIVDLHSRTGVWVNGMQIRWAWLDQGDAIRVGRLTFTMRYPRSSPAIGRREVPLETGAAPVDAAGPSRAIVVRPRPARELSVTARPPARLAPLPPAGRAEVIFPTSALESPGGTLDPGPADAFPAFLWQQQMRMMESFHDDMMAFVNNFMLLHGDQSSRLRGELERVEELTRELNSLKEKLTPLPAPTDDRTAARAPASGARTAQEPGVAADRPSRKQRLSEPTNDAGPPRPAPSDRAESPRTDHAAKPPAPSPSPVDGHGLLAERIISLQRRRQGYWQKLISQIAGNGSPPV
ncbi:FHA domain protein [Aquisphaera giovannonii]|uniref:FHA domain protein n=1 Tax=Aquisphaera giovannonii TaxID=406548 RepID=A0A5B9WC33_9BACT|nr:FHA domain-containing protein [Aquisphaera giovannonii]QEH37834.1 FHA domain protein [Aquisphaera giovannonii]